MGFFSNLNISMQEQGEPTVSLWVERMRSRLDYLWEQLETLLRLSEVPQLHDRYFYSNHVPEAYELPDTVQGTLAAIHSVTQQLEERQASELRYDLWLKTVRETGVTPDGQMVLPRHIFPTGQLQMQVA